MKKHLILTLIYLLTLAAIVIPMVVFGNPNNPSDPVLLAGGFSIGIISAVFVQKITTKL